MTVVGKEETELGYSKDTTPNDYSEPEEGMKEPDIVNKKANVIIITKLYCCAYNIEALYGKQ